jgi:hypothetical protein
MNNVILNLTSNTRNWMKTKKIGWQIIKFAKNEKISTKGTELIAPTTTEDSQTATIAPPPYKNTVDLFSIASH